MTNRRIELKAKERKMRETKGKKRCFYIPLF